MMEKCGHNDQFGICPLERGHSGEHAKVPHRTHSSEEVAQAEARGVQRGLQMAARHVEYNTVEFTTRWERITLAEEIRALAPASQPTAEPPLNVSERNNEWNKRAIKRHSKCREEIQNIADVDHDNRSEHAKDGEK